MFASVTTSTGQRPKAVHSTHSLLMRATKTEVRKIIADRLLQAREINGFSQTEAALKFGYKTPAQLSLWEQCRRMPPLAMLVRASAVYRVSLDYLMGVSPEPDRDPMSAERMQVLNAAQEMCEGMSRALADAIIAQTKVGGPTVQAAYAITGEGDRFLAATRRFMELNSKKFDDMRGGATLKSFADSFEINGLAVARDQIARHARTNATAVRVVLKKINAADRYSRTLFDPIDPLDA